MQEKLENLKVHCPDCPFTHNLSSKAIEQIIALFQETIEQAIPDEIDLRKLTNPNKAGASPQYPFHDKPMVVPVAQAEGFNMAIPIVKSNLLKAIGGDINVATKTKL